MTGMLRSRFDAFRVLGLGPQANSADIRRAFRKLAFATHPDRTAGRDDEFARIREAYEMLRAAGGGPTQAAPARPSLEMRVTVVTQDMQEACRALLADQARAFVSPGAAVAGTGRDHVPTAVRRKGRHLAYLVATPLAEGTNCVAVPVGDLADPRRVTPRLVRVNSARPGAGRVEVPEDMREALFPGARSVVIEFGEA